MSDVEKNSGTHKPEFDGEWVKLGDVATYVNGYAFKPSDYSADGLPIIRIQNLTGNVYETNRFSGTLPEKFKVANGDILISWSASLGVYRWSHGDAWLNQHIFKVVFDKLPVNVDFFVYQAGYLIENSANLAHGATMRHLTKKVFDSRPFYYPSSAIQARIARNLASIDVLLGSLRCQLSTLDDLVKSQFVEMFGDPCEPSPCSFPRVALKEVCELRTGPFGSALHKEDYVPGCHPLVNPSHVVDCQIVIDKNLTVDDDTYDSMKPYHLHIGDVVLGRRGEIGRCAVVSAEGLLCGTGCMIVRPNGNACRSDYLQRVFSFPSFASALEREAVGVTMKNLNAKIVGNAVIAMPPLALQQQFADFVARVDKLGFDCCREIVCCGVLFSSMSASLLCT